MLLTETNTVKLTWHVCICMKTHVKRKLHLKRKQKFFLGRPKGVLENWRLLCISVLVCYSLLYICKHLICQILTRNRTTVSRVLLTHILHLSYFFNFLVPILNVYISLHGFSTHMILNYSEISESKPSN